MDNKRCEITVALYGDTSDSSSVPDVAGTSSQYFIEAYAVRDAHDEESGWHYPVILRFADTDFVISWPGRKSDPAIDKNDGDARLLVKNDLESDKANLGCFYLARIELFDCCHGEQLTALRYSIDGRSIQMTTEGHAICIS